MIARVSMIILLALLLVGSGAAAYAEAGKPGKDSGANATPTVAPAQPAVASPDQAEAAVVLGSGFKYATQLALIDGSYDFQFQLYDAASGGALVGNPNTQLLDNKSIKAGVLIAALDFGPAFNGNERWLQVSFRAATSTGAYTLIGGRDHFLGAPNALGLRLPLTQSIQNNSGAGLFVINNGTGALSFGLRGDSRANYGVAGLSSSGFAGVYGSSTSNNGVYGLVDNGASGVYGRNLSSGAGVAGGGASGFGVVGNTVSGFAGVFGTGPHNGVYGDAHSSADSGVYGHNTVHGYGVSGISEYGTGIYGRTNTAGSNGVFGSANNGDGSGVYGQNDGAGFGVAGRSATGVGVLGSTSSGFALKADGNTTQALDKGGWVKAMLLIKNGAIQRCYNSQASGANVAANGCGFNSTRIGTGHYRVDFGYKVNDRFAAVTPVLPGPGAFLVIANLVDNDNNTENQLSISTNNTQGAMDGTVYIVVY